MKALFDQIDKTQERIQDGWCSKDKAYQLAAIILALRPALTVEIGVYAGKSFIPMALAHQAIKFGRIIGIDPYSNAAAVEGYTGDHKEWWGKTVNLEAILSAFMAHVQYFQVEEYCMLHRVKSDDFEVPAEVSLLHIDGQHSDQAIRDVQRYAPAVRSGGIVVMDDLGWPGGGVGRAVETLLGLGFEKLYDLDGGAVYQKTKAL